MDVAVCNNHLNLSSRAQRRTCSCYIDARCPRFASALWTLTLERTPLHLRTVKLPCYPERSEATAERSRGSLCLPARFATVVRAPDPAVSEAEGRPKSLHPRSPDRKITRSPTSPSTAPPASPETLRSPPERPRSSSTLPDTPSPPAPAPYRSASHPSHTAPSW